MSDLPRNEDGNIITSAEFGEHVIVEILWNTDANGLPVGDERSDDDNPRTLHGPFASLEEAQEWMNAYPDDTDVHDMHTIPLNAVRPKE